MKQIVLLTGATGFLGSHLAKAIVNAPGLELVILKRSTSDGRRIAELLPKVKSYDIDKTTLDVVFRENKVAHIIHTATEYGRNNKSSHEVLETNLMFPINLIEKAIEAGTKTFINTDSYFNKENMSYSFLLNYSLSKKSLLMWLKYFSQRIKIVNVMLEHIYGPFDNEAKFVEKMVQDIAIRKVPSIDLTYGHQKRDFIYVDDVVNAYLRLIQMSGEEEFKFREYTVGTGKSRSIRDLVETIQSLSKSPTKCNFGAMPYRDDEIMNSVADNLELRNLGWEPEVSLEAGLEKIIEIYRSRGS